MIVTELLRFVDNLMFTKTDKHLDDLQKRIIEGLFRGETYQQIADNYRYDEGYIGDLSRNLFKNLSNELGEKINKSNFSWAIERAINYKNIEFRNNKINYCVNSPQPDTNESNETEEKNTEKIYYHDLKLAPQIIKFYDRKSELKQLENLVLNQNIKLISVLGLSGIGKTYLVRKFVDLNLDKFEVIIWKNLKLTNSLEEIITDILTNINADLMLNENKLPQFLELLKTKKCLIIFDDFQELFISGKLAGQFKPKYEDYQNLLKIITEIEHQSSLILISQEQCQEMLCLDEELYPVKCLELEGLYNNEFLLKLGLKDQESWLNLINLYEGNPVYLQDIANLIKDIYDGKVADFLAENDLLLTQDRRSQLSELFKRLSPQEKQIIEQLSNSNQPMLREDLRKSLGLSSLELIEGLRSLKRRYLLKIIEGEKTLFDLSLVVREYVKNFIQD